MANKSTTTPSDEGWGAAIIFTLFTWLQGIVFAALKGKETLPRGVLIAAALALGGFVVWGIYHIIARRNRG